MVCLLEELSSTPSEPDAELVLEVNGYLQGWGLCRSKYERLLSAAADVLRPRVCMGDPFLRGMDRETRKVLDSLLHQTFVACSGVEDLVTSASDALSCVNSLLDAGTLEQGSVDPVNLKRLLDAFERLSHHISALPGDVWWPV